MNKVILVVKELMIVMVTRWMGAGGFALREDGEKDDLDVDGGDIGVGDKGRNSGKTVL